MRFAYARRGGPLLNWSGPTPPHQSRAGETRSLGDFYPTNRNSNALRRYGGRSPGHGGSAIEYEHNRELGAFYPTNRNSNALRRYGGVSAGHGGAAIDYEHNRALGGSFGYGSTGYHPAPGMGDFNVPRPGAPEIIAGYESPEPGSATVHLGGYIPEGAAVRYGQQMLGVESTTAKLLDLGLLRKASVIAAAYHGVKRNNGSVLWGLLWAAAAYVTPMYGILVPAVGIAQGFGQAKLRSNPARAGMKRKAGLARRRKAHRQRTRKLPSRTRRKTKLYIRTRPRTKRGH